MLLLLAMGDRDSLRALAKTASECTTTPERVLFYLLIRGVADKGQNNIAFASLLQLGDAKACAELLVKTDRAPEAALFARTYVPRLAPSWSSS